MPILAMHGILLLAAFSAKTKEAHHGDERKGLIG